MFDASVLAAYGNVIVVTMNYRLGVLEGPLWEKRQRLQGTSMQIRYRSGIFTDAEIHLTILHFNCMLLPAASILKRPICDTLVTIFESRRKKIERETCHLYAKRKLPLSPKYESHPVQFGHDREKCHSGE
ncbi:hypothetical protein PAMA_014037 [Pampus argenteus]